MGVIGIDILQLPDMFLVRDADLLDSAIALALSMLEVVVISFNSVMKTESGRLLSRLDFVIY